MAVRLSAANQGFGITANLPGFPFTIMGWFAVIVDGNQTHNFISYGDSAVPGAYVQLGADFSGGNTNLFIWDAINTVTGSNIVLNRWYHLALTIDQAPGGASTCLGYLNGVLDITNAASTSAVTDEWMTIGDNVDNEFFNGLCAAIKIWSRQLSQQEIQQEMWSYLPQNWNSLYGYYPMWNAATANFDFGPLGRHWTRQGAGAVNASGPPIFMCGLQSPTYVFERVAAAGGGTQHQGSLLFNSIGDISPRATASYQNGIIFLSDTELLRASNVVRRSQTQLDSKTDLVLSGANSSKASTLLDSKTDTSFASQVNRLGAYVLDAKTHLIKSANVASVGNLLFNGNTHLLATGGKSILADLLMDSKTHQSFTSAVTRLGSYLINSNTDLISSGRISASASLLLNSISHLLLSGGKTSTGSILINSDTSLLSLGANNILASMLFDGKTNLMSTGGTASVGSLLLNSESNLINLAAVARAGVFGLPGMSDLFMTPLGTALETGAYTLDGLSNLIFNAIVASQGSITLDSKSILSLLPGVSRVGSFELPAITSLYQTANINRTSSLFLDSVSHQILSSSVAHQGSIFTPGNTDMLVTAAGAAAETAAFELAALSSILMGGITVSRGSVLLNSPTSQVISAAATKIGSTFLDARSHLLLSAANQIGGLFLTGQESHGLFGGRIAAGGSFGPGASTSIFMTPLGGAVEVAAFELGALTDLIFNATVSKSASSLMGSRSHISADSARGIISDLTLGSRTIELVSANRSLGGIVTLGAESQQAVSANVAYLGTINLGANTIAFYSVTVTSPPSSAFTKIIAIDLNMHSNPQEFILNLYSNPLDFVLNMKGV